jgi:hypothetical protein
MWLTSRQEIVLPEKVLAPPPQGCAEKMTRLPSNNNFHLASQFLWIGQDLFGFGQTWYRGLSIRAWASGRFIHIF